jgi:peptidoglycan/LPS O-acetylase OafA/YrhL
MRRIELIDYARFLAAVAVLAFHYGYGGIVGGKLAYGLSADWLRALCKYGYLGVAFFFMISGYVIFYSAHSRDALSFMKLRFWRLYPAYIAGVVLTTFSILVLGGNEFSVTLKQFFWNLTMFQTYLGHEHVDGVYWTLLIEMKFYGAVFLLLLFRQGKRLSAVCIAWPFVMLCAEFTGYNHLPLLGRYYTFFAAGALFAVIKEKRTWLRMTALLLSYILSIRFLNVSAMNMPVFEDAVRSPWVVTSIVSCFFGCFLLFNSEKMAALRLPYSRMLGALSYPLYLVHAYIGYMLINALGQKVAIWQAYSVTIIVVTSLAYGICCLVEAPVNQWRHRHLVSSDSKSM